MDPQSLFPIDHRSVEVRQDLVALRARDAVVSVRRDPRDEIVLAMRFDSIQAGGVVLPLRLEATGRRDLRGGAVFAFHGSGIVLDEKFKSVWHVRGF
jgi:hypothetical protein